MKGKGVDLEKAAHTLLQDYRSGALGRISLETPQTREVLLAEHQAMLDAKAAAKAALVEAPSDNYRN